MCEESHSIHNESKKIKTRWTNEQDQQLIDAVQKYGTSNWSKISEMVEGRTGKQCRERWTGQLDSYISKESWTMEEDYLLLYYQKQFGNKWALIAKYIPYRSPMNIKNRWHHYTRYTPKPKHINKKPNFEPISFNDEKIFGKDFEEFRSNIFSKINHF